ncbi:MAG: septum formation initiator family protein [Clostridia bacterium]|nr:septum formation initiator family protein [Clostridia bacterium]
MKNRSNIFVKTAVLVFVIFCSVTIIRMQFEFNELKEDKEQVEEQIKNYQLRIDELQAQLDEQFNTDYIMRVARDKLNYRLPDEIIFYNDLSK